MDHIPPASSEKRPFAPDTLETLNDSLIGADFSLIGSRKFPVFAGQEIGSEGSDFALKSAPQTPLQADFQANFPVFSLLIR